MKNSAATTSMLAMSAMLSASSFILSLFEFPVPLTPSFARMDLSDFPALIGAFASGPVSGLLIELVKNVLHLFRTSTGGVGELANLIMGGSYVGTAGLIYQFHKTKIIAGTACIIASLVMVAVAALTNYFILLPMFEQFTPLDAVIASFGELIPFIKTKLDVVLYNAFLFILLQGLVIGGFAMLLYKHLSPILKGAKGDGAR